MRPADTNDDPDILLALAVVDREESGESVAQAETHPGLAAELAHIERIRTALESFRGDDRLHTPPPCATWGPFLLKEQVGRGSFGVVCRGFDPAVSREIAVKLYAGAELPSEPRLMARVHHPNVLTVFGAAIHEGRPGIWMELVRGRTLAERLQAEGPLPIPEVIRIGAQLCDALQAVHDAHLVHQDVKARNVMERDSGEVVLMDFGAGGARSTGGDAPARVAGTPLYMAPEILGGQAPSARSDVYSLGVLLYYLLTGTYPTAAASWTQLRREREGPMRPASPAQIRQRLHSLRPDVPRSLVRAVAKALAPVADRWPRASELRAALERVRLRSEPWVDRRWLKAAAVVVAAAAGLGAAVTAGFLVGRSVGPPAITLTRLTNDPGLTADPVRSRDGRLLAYASDRDDDTNLDIWVKRIPDGAPLRLTSEPGDESQPAFTPDGTHIAYRSERGGGGIYMIPAFGGEARLMIPGGRHPRFSPDGRHLAYLGGKGFGNLLFATVAGGPVYRQVDGVRTPPIWSPDGKHLLFIRGTADGVDWWVARFPPEGPESLVRTGAFTALARHGIETLTAWPVPNDWEGDRILFQARTGDTTNIWQVGLSPSFSVAGTPIRAMFSTEDQHAPSFGADGSILFSTRIENPYLWELPIEAEQGRASGTPRPVRAIHHHPGRGIHDLSADGRRIVYASVLPRVSGISMMDLETGLETIVTTPSESVVERYPVISSDGKTVYYAAEENGESTIRRVAVDGGMPEKVCSHCGRPLSISEDGRFLTLQFGVPERAALGILDMTSGRYGVTLKHDSRELYRGHLSPDGRWITFHSALASGPTLEMVAPFKGLTPVNESEWIRVTSGDHWTDSPQWSPGGNLLYYVANADGFRCLWAQPLDPATKQPRGEPMAVLHTHSRRRSIGNVHHWGVELTVTRGKLVFSMGETRGNLWIARPMTR